MATLMPNTDLGDVVPEAPRTILEADADGCCRWIVRLQPDTAYGLNESIDVLLWMWADGSIHVATRPALHSDWSWSPPMYPDRL